MAFCEMGTCYYVGFVGGLCQFGVLRGFCQFKFLLCCWLCENFLIVCFFWHCSVMGFNCWGLQFLEISSSNVCFCCYLLSNLVFLDNFIANLIRGEHCEMCSLFLCLVCWWFMSSWCFGAFSSFKSFLIVVMCYLVPQNYLILEQ